MSAEQVEVFSRFTGAPSQSELDRFCVLSVPDVERVRQRRRPQNRLGFAVQLVTVRMLGRFLPDPLEARWEIVERLAGQVDVDDPSCLKQYAQRLPTQHEHARESRRRMATADSKTLTRSGSVANRAPAVFTGPVSAEDGQLRGQLRSSA